MNVKSLTRNGFEFQIIEVELTLLRGLPTVRVLGLPDTLIKESVNRLKAALVSQEYQWPKAQHMLFNLRPAHERKTSHGLDLALAVALLQKTGQMEIHDNQDLIFYGELGLDGSVHAPDDLNFLPENIQQNVVSGKPSGWQRQRGFEIQSLTDAIHPQEIQFHFMQPQWSPPEVTYRMFSPAAADVLRIAAAGEHTVMIGGPAGTGKTTFVDTLFQLLSEPDESEFSEAKRWALQRGETPKWRPFVAPHHTTPTMSMLGGGVPPLPGEFTRAHSGLLFLDEYLEFDSKVQEALREPMETGDIHIARRGDSRSYPARFMTVAATNLCPCGRYRPNEIVKCGRTLHACHSHLRRLSGPVLDRFDILSYSHKWKGSRSVSSEQLKQEVERAVAFRKARGQALSNGRLAVKDFEGVLSPSTFEIMLPSGDFSERRRRAILRVARTLADLEGESKIQLRHLSRAREFALKPFLEIESL